MATKQKAALLGAQDGAGAAQTAGAGGSAQALAVQGSGALALPSDLAAELAGYAQEAAAKERPSISKISLKSGMMQYQGQPMPGNKMDVIIIAYAYRNALYKNKYDPNNVVNPNCFSISLVEEGMAPHENVVEKEHATCDGCPNAEWASDPNSPSGRGKWCKEGRRLIAMPAAAMASAEAIAKAELAIVDVPVTSVGNFGNYVNTLSAAVKRPMWAVVTTLQVVPDAKTQMKLTFTPVEMINDASVIHAIKERMAEAERAALVPYDESAIAGDAKPAAPVKKGKFTR